MVYKDQRFTFEQSYSNVEFNQLEDNIRDHVHDADGVGGMSRLIRVDSTVVNITSGSNHTDTVVYSGAIPGGILGSTGRIRVSIFGNLVSKPPGTDVNTAAWGCFFGGTLVASSILSNDLGSISVRSEGVLARFDVAAQNSLSNAQYGVFSVLHEANLSGGVNYGVYAPFSASLDVGADQNLTVKYTTTGSTVLMDVGYALVEKIPI